MLAGRVPSSDARMAFPSECERCRPGHTKISISALRPYNADMLILPSQPCVSRKKFWEKSFGTAKCKSWLWKNILGKHFGCGFATLREFGIALALMILACSANAMARLSLNLTGGHCNLGKTGQGSQRIPLAKLWARRG